MLKEDDPGRHPSSQTLSHLERVMMKSQTQGKKDELLLTLKWEDVAK